MLTKYFYKFSSAVYATIIHRRSIKGHQNQEVHRSSKSWTVIFDQKGAANIKKSSNKSIFDQNFDLRTTMRSKNKKVLRTSLKISEGHRTSSKSRIEQEGDDWTGGLRTNQKSSILRTILQPYDWTTKLMSFNASSSIHLRFSLCFDASSLNHFILS